MLSAEENEQLTRVGPGTLMGDLLRQYWQPFLLSRDLPGPDCPPVRVRLLGEDLVAFRTAGAIGLLGDHCPHRGASLFFGRNEEEGLRCVYHGWKFDVSGACVDMPNEPGESNFKHKIRHVAYPCRERTGIIWAYMGPLAEPPDLPALEWNLVPEDHVYHSIRIAENNFMQAIEGEYDTTHIGFLHQRNTAPYITPGTPDELNWGFIARKYKWARFEIAETDYGVLIGTRRDLVENGELSYWRVYPFGMPFHTMIPGGGAEPTFSGHAWVPMDDEHTICLCWDFNAVRPLNEAELGRLHNGDDGLQGLHPTMDVFQPATGGRPYSRYWPELHYDNDFGLDHGAQKTSRFSGLPGTWPQDSAMHQSMGRVVNRTIEHLGTADTGQIAIRRRMLRAARALREHGTPPPGALDPIAYWLRPVSTLLPANSVSWVEAIREQMEAGGPIKGDRLSNGNLLGGGVGSRQGA